MYRRTVQLLKENQDKLNELSELLLKKEVIFRDDLELIFGKRKFKSEREELAEEIEDGVSELPPSDSHSDRNTDVSVNGAHEEQESKKSDETDVEEKPAAENPPA